MNACIKTTVLLVLAGCSAMLGGQAAAADAADSGTIVNTADISWGDAPPSMPKGAKLAVLHGDPGKPVPFTLRLMLPAGYKIAPHWHSSDEQLTVISGTFYLGMGDVIDAAKAHTLRSGGFHFLPGKAHHYAFTKEPTVVQVHGTGPFDINYINPADDPQHAK